MMLAAGDFNVVKSPTEKSGKEALTLYEKEFGDCLYSIEVLDHSFSGPLYSQSNKTDEDAFVAQEIGSSSSKYCLVQ